MELPTEKHRRYVATLRHWLDGRRDYDSLRALDLAQEYHVGERLDGAPEFSHQISIALYLRSIADSVQDISPIIAAALMHDLVEDYDIAYDTILERFGPEIADAVLKLTKVFATGKIPNEKYYAGMATCPIASMVKGADRMHNIQSMIKPFTLQRQRKYIKETREFVLPMLKEARHRFPHQLAAYQNIRHVLVSQIEIIELMHEGLDKE